MAADSGEGSIVGNNIACYVNTIQAFIASQTLATNMAKSYLINTLVEKVQFSPISSGQYRFNCSIIQMQSQDSDFR